jgi:hypothetical protein
MAVGTGAGPLSFFVSVQVLAMRVVRIANYWPRPV